MEFTIAHRPAPANSTNFTKPTQQKPLLPGHLFLLPDHSSNTDPRAPPTLCLCLHETGFTQIHRLQCGHMIFTSQPDSSCGSNCALSPDRDLHNPRLEVAALRFLCHECIASTPEMEDFTTHLVGRATKPEWLYGIEGNEDADAHREKMVHALEAAGLIPERAAQSQEARERAMEEFGLAGVEEQELFETYVADSDICELVVCVLSADPQFFDRAFGNAETERAAVEGVTLGIEGMAIQQAQGSEVQSAQPSIDSVTRGVRCIDLDPVRVSEGTDEMYSARCRTVEDAIQEYQETGEMDPGYLAGWDDERFPTCK